MCCLARRRTACHVRLRTIRQGHAPTLQRGEMSMDVLRRTHRKQRAAPSSGSFRRQRIFLRPLHPRQQQVAAKARWNHFPDSNPRLGRADHLGVKVAQVGDLLAARPSPTSGTRTLSPTLNLAGAFLVWDMITLLWLSLPPSGDLFRNCSPWVVIDQAYVKNGLELVPHFWSEELVIGQRFKPWKH